MSVLFSSCVRNGSNETKSYKNLFYDLNLASYIEDVDISSSLSINDISCIEELLQLEITDSSLLSVHNMQLDSSMYGYVVSCMREPVMLFDHSGNHKYNLINIGRGPGETNGFLYKWQLCGDELFLSENMKMISVHLNSKEITEYFFDKYIYNLLVGPDGLLYALVSLGPESNLNYFIEVYDSEFNIISKVFYPDKKRLKYSMPNSFTGNLETNELFLKYDGTIFSKRAFCDTMFTIDNRGVLAPYISWGRDRAMPNIESVFDSELNRKSIFVDNYAESENYIFIKCSCNKKIYTIILNKATLLPIGRCEMDVNESSSIINSPFFINYTTSKGDVIKIGIIAINEHVVYCVVRSVDAINFVADFNEDDNPVILKFRLK